MAVYTKISDEEIFELVDEYDIGDVVFCKGIAEGVENSNYLLQTSIDNYILTIYEKRVNPDDLPFFLNLMKHLSQKGLNCPTPIKGKDGNALRKIQDKPAALTSFLKGVSTKKIKNEHCAKLGEAHAKLHLAGLDFDMQRKNSLTIDNWRALFEKSASKADGVIEGLSKEIEEELFFLEKNWNPDLPRGIIHADLFPDNVFFFER
jgi:homoserine kinase type II